MSGPKAATRATSAVLTLALTAGCASKAPRTASDYYASREYQDRETLRQSLFRGNQLLLSNEEIDRFATISYRWDGKKKLLLLRLSGQWLHDAGFPLGQELEITVHERRLVIEAV